MSRTALYRHFDANGCLLYVGITDCLHERDRQHVATSHWHKEVARTETQWCLSRAHAEALERVAVQFEKPAHNVMHTLPPISANRVEAQATADLLRDVLNFCAVNAMPQSVFGKLALGDPGFVRNLSEGREVRAKTLRRVVEFMQARAA